MEDFYPFTSEDIPEIGVVIASGLSCMDSRGRERKEIATSLLLPLAIDMLEDNGRIKSLKNTFQKEFREYNSDAKVSDGFWKIVEAYLEENNGTGNLSRITEVLRSNDHHWIADSLEKLTLQYSLPVSSEEGTENANVYDLSRDFLNAMKDTTGDSESSGDGRSVEKALQNSVIMVEIFKKLQPRDQKLFRLVSPTWMEETFAFWRGNSKIFIYAYATRFGMSMSLFINLWEKNLMLEEPKDAKMLTWKARTRKGKNKAPELAIEGSGNYKLQSHPFRSYQVTYNFSDKRSLLSCGPTENKFWELCGQHIEDLKIKNASVQTKILQRLLLDVCPNLKRLDLSTSSIKDVNTQPILSTPETMKIAKNLHTLILDNINEESLRNLLFICPNLKDLNFYSTSDQEVTGALLSPACNGEFIKLRKLVMRKPYGVDSFRSLRRYTEMLAKNKFDPLEHFELIMRLFNARAPPFNLYAALARTSSNLKTLVLELEFGEENLVNDNSKLFMDLSPFLFPNLTTLKLVMKGWNVDLKFDFGTLKGMPMLEKLEIKFINLHREVTYFQYFAKKDFRKAVVKDCVYEGDRNSYLPLGVTVDYCYSAEDPILCSKLKEFTFVGWCLDNEDVQLLSTWFPNLTHLEAEMSPDALPVFLENWQRLDKLVIHTEKLISLKKLRPLKVNKKHLRIFQRISGMRVMVNDKDTDMLVELKEFNGRIFFLD